jgi:uncharacterized membrane protein YeiH
VSDPVTISAASPLLERVIETSGVIVAALSGIDGARRKGMDAVGAYTIGLVTAFGGGTLRDLLIDRRPFYWVAHDHLLVIVAILAVVLLYVRPLARLHGTGIARATVVALDTAALGLFTMIGTAFAMHAERPMPPVACVLLGVMSGCFGGVCRDVLLNETPAVFMPGELYASAAGFGSAAYLVAVRCELPEAAATVIGVVVCAVVRVVSHHWRVHLPGPTPTAEDGTIEEAVRREEWRFVPTLGESAPSRPLEVAVHPLRSPRIVVLLPGYDGSIDGYAEKYTKIAELLRARGVGAVVRSGNPIVAGQAFEVTCRARVRGLLGELAARAPSICGHATPDVLLVGVSAGASAMAAEGAGYPQVKRMLLLAPSHDAGSAAVEDGLARFTGELFVVVGADDEVVGDLPAKLLPLATKAARRELRVVPGCDHLFRGARNGRVMSHAPLWAFLGEGDGPDPERGIHLYD